MFDSQNMFFGLVSEMSRLYNSSTFSILKFILGIYVLVLFIDIILLLFQRGLGQDFRFATQGMNIPKELTTKKDKVRVKWEKICARLESENESEYKVAVIEADNIIEDLIRRLGYKGENLSEIIDGIAPGQVENIEEIQKSHEVRNRIIHDESFKLSRQDANNVIKAYEKFLESFEVL